MVRVIDASALPSLTTVNPMVAVLMLAERGAELVRAAGRYYANRVPHTCPARDLHTGVLSSGA